MRDWLIKIGLAILSFIGGALIGVYKTTLDYESELKVIKADIKLEIRQIAYDVEHDIMAYIQNNILTKPIGK